MIEDQNRVNITNEIKPKFDQPISEKLKGEIEKMAQAKGVEVNLDEITTMSQGKDKIVELSNLK